MVDATDRRPKRSPRQPLLDRYRGRSGLLTLASWLVLLAAGCDRDNAVALSLASVASTGGSAVQVAPPEVRVLLFEADSVVLGSRNGGYTLCRANQDKPFARLSAGELVHVQASGATCVVKRAQGKNLLGRGAGGSFVEIRPEGGALLQVGQSPVRAYRGKLRCLANGDDTLSVVNVVDVESYLAGVVGSEMFASWPREALRAQSIASRTYALYQMVMNNKDKQWDLGSDQSSQVYFGLASERASVTEAVRDTRGAVLTFGQPGRERLFSTYFCSTCGGHTADGSSVFGDSLEPLSGRPCGFCSHSPYYRWASVTIPKKAISRRLLERYPELAPLGDIRSVTVRAKSDCGRVDLLELTGSTGKKRVVRAVDFRLAVTRRESQLRSSWYQLVDTGQAYRFEQGRGFGHGVGLCQYGSEKMAGKGHDCVAILNHYYPGATLLRAY